MSQIKYGLTSWDEVELKANNFQRKKDQYMRLESGNNLLRIVTRPHQYMVHNYKEEGDSGFGDRILCSRYHGACPVCEKDDKPKRRWLLGVIERKTQTSKILDISVAVFKAIQELSRDEDYGDPVKYDIDVKVDKQGGATGYYTVIPKPPKPLSAADLEIKNKIDTEELLRKCTPPTYEQAQQRLDSVRNRKNGKAAPPVEMEESSGDDNDYVFPAANV